METILLQLRADQLVFVSGDIYQLPSAQVVVPDVTVSTLRPTELTLAPGRYFYRFIVTSYERNGEFTLEGASTNRTRILIEPNKFATTPAVSDSARFTV